MAVETGKLVFALHAHLPWVRHPGHEDPLQERWLFDAITETYLPLIDRLFRLRDEGIPVRITLSLSPTLLGMLADPLLQARYVRHLDRLVLFTDSEVHRLRHEPAWQPLAIRYREAFRRARRSFLDRHHGHLIAALRDLAESGVVELAASAASHALLPLHTQTPESIRAQIQIGVEEFHRHFGWAPSGFWLPECGFSPDLDAPLAEAQVKWTFLEGHGIALAQPSPVLGLRAPIVTPKGVAVFGRDRGLARVAWSTRDGYPGDPDYRDFDTDVAFELSDDALRHVLPIGSERVATGVKYYRITAASEEKAPYDPARADAKVRVHGADFVSRCREWLAAEHPGDRPGSLVAAYDAELFGHWWHEGLEWLEQVVRAVADDPRGLELATPGDLLEAHPVLQVAQPAASTWGDGGYHGPWLSGENDWLCRPLRAAAERMVELARHHPAASGSTLRALNQAARELLLAQASDWPLMMSRGTSADYAIGRARRHLGDFAAIGDAIEAGRIDIDRLSEIEGRDNVFPAIDYRSFLGPNENGADR